MDYLKGLMLRVVQLLRRDVADERSEEELRFHVEMETAKNVAAGLPPAEARRRALIAFGGVEQHTLDLRDGRRLTLLEDLWRDIRHGVRALRRNPASTVFAVLIVGVGIGASATVFSLVHALLLRPLPLDEPDRLVWIANGRSGDLSARTVQGAHLETLRRGRMLSEVAGYHAFYAAGDHHLRADGEPQRVTSVGVTSGFFRLLGVEPMLGRSMSRTGISADGLHEVLLSHDTWRRLFASDPTVAGRTFTLHGSTVTVAGVLPAGFDFGGVFAPGTHVDVFTRFPVTAETNRLGNTLALVGRLADDVTPQAAQREAALLVSRAASDGADHNAFDPHVSLLSERVSGSFRLAMLVLSGTVGVVMLIVCLNLSNLLLTRATVRESEFTLRAWLGAGRARLVRQLLTEGMLLSCAGAVLGIMLAIVGTRTLAQSDALTLPLLEQVHVNRMVLAFTAGIAVATGLLFGLAPALRLAAPPSFGGSVNTSARMSAGRRQRRLGNGVVVVEVALACMLLVAAGLLIRSFISVLAVDPGFRPEGSIALRIDPTRTFASPSERILWYQEALESVSAAPAVSAAGLTDVLPFSFNRSWSVGAADRTYAKGEKPEAFVRIVSEGFLPAMGIALRAGRDFTSRDNAASPPVIMINETLARELWPNADPLGRIVRIGGNPDREVVGVVADTRHQALEDAAGPELYIPIRQSGDYSAMYVVGRGSLPPAQTTAIIRNALRPLDASLPLADALVLQEIVDRALSPRRLIVLLVTGFAAFALLLASLGIYAVVALGVKQRQREFGIRLALGASPLALQRRILGETLSLAAPGIVIGLLGTWMFARAIRSLLFGVPHTDPVTLVFSVAVLTGVTVLAGWLPARRAARLPVIETLRAE